jgi:hypothetical protein
LERLRRHARLSLDAPDAAINRALDALEDFEADEEQAAPLAERRINPIAIPTLTHTKVLQAFIGRDEIRRPSWNRPLHEMLRPCDEPIGEP